MPYLVCSEGHHVASGALNRWTLQPGITDVKSQVQSMAPWVAANLGKKVTMIYPDYAFGYDHRDFFSEAMEAQGGEMRRADRDPADRDLLHPLPAAHPEGHRGALPRDGRPRRPHLRQGARRVLRLGRPPGDLRLHRLARGGRHRQPRPRVPRRHPLLGGPPALQAAGRDRVRDLLPRRRSASTTTAPSVADAKEVSTYAHMFSAWETLFVIKAGDGGRRLQGPRRPPGLRRGDRGDDDDARLATSTRRATRSSTARPTRSSATSTSRRSRAASSTVVHTTSIEDGLYPDEVDYTTHAVLSRADLDFGPFLLLATSRASSWRRSSR